MFGLLSALSAYSLIIFGAFSLIFSTINFSLAGIAISLAMLAHGIYERCGRNAFLDTHDLVWSRRMAVNQLALAGSLTLYALWQLYALDEEEVRKILLQDAVKPLFRLVDPGMQIELMKYLPAYVRAVYWGIIGLAWLGCGATAAYYVQAAKSLVTRGKSDFGD